MPEMPYAGENHRHLAFVRRSDDLFVAHGTTGLDGSGRTGFRCGDQPVSERKECIAADGASFDRESGLACFPNGDSRGIHSCHLARADAESPILGRVYDGV